VGVPRAGHRSDVAPNVRDGIVLLGRGEHRRSVHAARREHLAVREQRRRCTIAWRRESRRCRPRVCASIVELRRRDRAAAAVPAAGDEHLARGQESGYGVQPTRGRAGRRPGVHAGIVELRARVEGDAWVEGEPAGKQYFAGRKQRRRRVLTRGGQRTCTGPLSGRRIVELAESLRVPRAVATADDEELSIREEGRGVSVARSREAAGRGPCVRSRVVELGLREHAARSEPTGDEDSPVRQQRARRVVPRVERRRSRAPRPRGRVVEIGARDLSGAVESAHGEHLSAWKERRAERPSNDGEGARRREGVRLGIVELGRREVRPARDEHLSVVQDSERRERAGRRHRPRGRPGSSDRIVERARRRAVAQREHVAARQQHGHRDVALDPGGARSGPRVCVGVVELGRGDEAHAVDAIDDEELAGREKDRRMLPALRAHGGGAGPARRGQQRAALRAGLGRAVVRCRSIRGAREEEGPDHDPRGHSACAAIANRHQQAPSPSSSPWLHQPRTIEVAAFSISDQRARRPGAIRGGYCRQSLRTLDGHWPLAYLRERDGGEVDGGC